MSGGGKPSTETRATAAMGPTALGRRMQVAFVVKDLDATLRFWTEVMGIGPFVVIEDATSDRRYFHRGEFSSVQATLAFSYVGETQIEIIQQNNAAPSPFTEFHAQGHEGLHHIAFWPKEFAAACAELEARGFESVCSIAAEGSSQRIEYYAAPAHIGVMVEIAPVTPERTRYFDGIKRLADTWDGSRPIRTFRTRAEYMNSPDCPSL